MSESLNFWCVSVEVLLSVRGILREESVFFEMVCVCISDCFDFGG